MGWVEGSRRRFSPWRRGCCSPTGGTGSRRDWVAAGLGRGATTTWLHGDALTPVLALAWVLLFGAPVVAGSIAARLSAGPDGPHSVSGITLRQGAAAGFLATGVGGLIVTVLGTGTIALMP